MKTYNTIICLNFLGSELEPATWLEIDKLCQKSLLMTVTELVTSKKLPKVDCLLVKLGAKIDKKIINRLPNLKYIGMLGSGYGGIDIKYSNQKGITVTNITDYATQSVVEFTFGMLLEHLRDLGRAYQQAKDGDYSDNFSGGEIKGKKFGVIGLGYIGLRTAQLAQAFGAEVCYWSHNRKMHAEAAGIKYCELEELLSSSDIITLNLALNPETLSIINAEKINMIKPSAIFINPSPMELIDFEALVVHLKRNDITFMLDHSDEMTPGQLRIIQTIDNFLVYPPIGYLTKEASQLKQGMYADNLRNSLNAKPGSKVN